MRIFSGLIVCFLAVVLLLAGGTVDIHAQNASLDFIADIGIDRVYAVGDTVTVPFVAILDGAAAPGVRLTITHNGLRDVVISNGGTTNLLGTVTVTGTLAAISDVYIQAEWSAQGRRVRGDFNVEDTVEETPLEAEPAHKGSLEVLGHTGLDKFYPVGSTVEAIFVAKLTGVAAPGEKLIITHNGLRDVVISNGGTTNVLGMVTVTGTIVDPSAYIEAKWATEQLIARADLCCAPIIITPAAIVVNPPDPKSPLKVGDIFTQTIDVQNAADLAGWQMDIAFNSDVLEVVDISEGDFLEQDGTDALFLDEQSPGKIAVRQVRVRGPGAPMSGVYGSGLLVELQLRFLSFSETLLSVQNVRLSDSSGERLSYTVTLTPVVATHTPAAAEDINQDGRVDILDLVAVAGSIGAARPNLRADVNDDGIVDILDLVAIAGSPEWGKIVPVVRVREPNAAAPAASVLPPPPETIQEWIALARIQNDGSLLFQQGIVNLERLLAVRVPSKTRLLLNYPNPFNPETWIPYQLSEASEVTVSVYSVNGNLIRTLALGHQAAGIYQSKSRAAYWDGRNEYGERVASGLYFYTLTAGDFTATRKMLIRK